MKYVLFLQLQTLCIHYLIAGLEQFWKQQKNTREKTKSIKLTLADTESWEQANFFSLA